MILWDDGNVLFVELINTETYDLALLVDKYFNLVPVFISEKFTAVYAYVLFAVIFHYYIVRGVTCGAAEYKLNDVTSLPEKRTRPLWLFS